MGVCKADHHRLFEIVLKLFPEARPMPDLVMGEGST